MTVHTIPENFLRGLFDERPTMENHSCRRGEEEERVGEDGVRNGGVWKTIYREGGSKNGWKAINVVKKRGKTRFLDLTNDKKTLEKHFACGADHRS